MAQENTALLDAPGRMMWTAYFGAHRLHDLRHLAATLMLTSGVPLPLVSKNPRHAQTGITADFYGHLTQEAALVAADSLGDVLDAAATELANERGVRCDHIATT